MSLVVSTVFCLLVATIVGGFFLEYVPFDRAVISLLGLLVLLMLVPREAVGR